MNLKVLKCQKFNFHMCKILKLKEYAKEYIVLHDFEVIE